MSKKYWVALKLGKHVFYIGAGTSGRLGGLDASEMPPTYSVPEDWFQGIIAGGDLALRKSIEGAEDKVESGIDGKIIYDCRVIKRKDSTFVVLSQSSEINVEDMNGRVIERHKLPYGTILNFASGSKIKQGDDLAKWDPLTRPKIAEVAGKAKFVDIDDGITA